jgi:small subunit ribosomal protein S15
MNTKQDLIKSFQKHDKDTGSPEVQIAILTSKIVRLMDHFAINSKDHASKRGFLQLIHSRMALLKYLKKTNLVSYKSLIARLSLRDVA